MFTCASLFASFLNMLPRASAAGVSAFTYQSIDGYTNTPYGKRKEPFRSLVKNDVCMSHLGGRSFSRRLSFHLSSQTRYRE